MTPKHAARTLAVNLAARAISIKHVQALDLIAAGSGLANRHVLASLAELPPIKRINLALLTSAATVLAQHDLSRRQALIEETSSVLMPAAAAEELLTVWCGKLVISSREIANPDDFLSTDRGAAFVDALCSGLYYQRWTTDRSDRPLSLDDGNALAAAILDAKREGARNGSSAKEISTAVQTALFETLGRGQDVDDFWWHYGRSEVESELDSINSELEDVGAPALLDVDDWLSSLEDHVFAQLCDEDDSEVTDKLGSQDRAELLFVFQREGHTIDQLVSSSKRWPKFDSLVVDAPLQHALACMGYSVAEYRAISENKSPSSTSDPLRRGVRKRAERIISPEKLEEVVDNASANMFVFAIYAVVTIDDLLALDVTKPISVEKPALGVWNPYSGTFMEERLGKPILLNPREGLLLSGGDGVSPDNICGFYLPCFHSRVSNLVEPTSAAETLTQGA